MGFVMGKDGNDDEMRWSMTKKAGKVKCLECEMEMGRCNHNGGEG